MAKKKLDTNGLFILDLVFSVHNYLTRSEEIALVLISLYLLTIMSLFPLFNALCDSIVAPEHTYYNINN